jgi:hypothetical protein
LARLGSGRGELGGFDGEGGWKWRMGTFLFLLILSLRFVLTCTLTAPLHPLAKQEPRTLLTLPTVLRLSASLVTVTLTLDPIRTPTTYALRDEGNYEVDEDGREVAVRKIKIVSRGRQRDRVSVCGWELDGWSI